MGKNRNFNQQNLTAEQKEILGVKDDFEETSTENLNEENTDTSAVNVSADGDVTDLPDSPAIDPDSVNVETAVVTPIEQVSPEAIPEAIPEVTEPVVETQSEPEEVMSTKEEIQSRSQQAIMVISSIEQYISDMAPRKPVTQTSIDMNQVKLYRAIQMCINNLDSEFKEIYTKILSMFEEHKGGAFRETHVFRGADTMPLPEDDRKAFHRLINLLKVTANPQSRSIALKQVDLQASTQYGITEVGRNRILAFYNKD